MVSKNNNFYGLLQLEDYSSHEWDFGDYEEEDSSLKCYPCKNPWEHKFIEKILLVHKHRECTICGYSPELDGSKLDFETCHNEFIAWQKSRKK